MDSEKLQPDAELKQTDPAFDALLDEAVSAGAPPMDPALTDRIYRQTAPMLSQRPVLARIGPAFLKVAAAVAIVAGGVLAVAMLNQTPDPITGAGTTVAENTKVDVEAMAGELAAINDALEPGNTLIDEQIDMLALRVEMADTEGAWGSEGLNTDDLIERAVVRFEIDQLSDETALMLDEPMLF